MNDMRILADENLPAPAVAALRERGHAVFSACTEMPGAPDTEVLARAQAEDRVLITFDKDFGELAFRHGLPASCGVVLFRLSSSSLDEAVRAVVAALESRSDWPGHFSVIEEGRVRHRPLPDRGR